MSYQNNLSFALQESTYKIKGKIRLDRVLFDLMVKFI